MLKLLDTTKFGCNSIQLMVIKEGVVTKQIKTVRNYPELSNGGMTLGYHA